MRAFDDTIDCFSPATHTTSSPRPRPFIPRWISKGKERENRKMSPGAGMELFLFLVLFVFVLALGSWLLALSLTSKSDQQVPLNIALSIQFPLLLFDHVRYLAVEGSFE
jgi:hypothetical protein